jgi:hypothetical protein
MLVTFEPNKFLNEFQANVESFGDLTLDSYLNTNRLLGKVNFVSGSIKILKTIEININKAGTGQISGICHCLNIYDINIIRIRRRHSHCVFVHAGNVAHFFWQ